MRKDVRAAYLLAALTALFAAVLAFVMLRHLPVTCTTITVVAGGLAIGAMINRSNHLPTFAVVWLMAVVWGVLSEFLAIPIVSYEGFTSGVFGEQFLYWYLPAVASVLLLPLFRWGWERMIRHTVQPNASTPSP